MGDSPRLTRKLADGRGFVARRAVLKRLPIGYLRRPHADAAHLPRRTELTAFDGQHVYYLPNTGAGVAMRFDAKSPASMPSAYKGSFY